MNETQQFSSVDQERWSEIREFPGYTVSDQGRVRNMKFDRMITPTVNTHGSLMVGLSSNNKQVKRSLALLVATEFVPLSDSPTFDTPIHRNGDRTDVRYTNLMWRPLWFARRYMKQFSDGHSTIDSPVEDIKSGEIYATSMDASMVNAVLDADIVFGIHNNVYVWPTHQYFRRAL